ncbi:MAG: flagellar hook-basal body complex protein, partial [Alkalispirochaetaceae bacterium]
HTLRVDFTRVEGQENVWQASVQIDPEADTPVTQSVAVGGIESEDDQTFNLEFSNDGTLLRVFNDAGGVDNEDQLGVELTYDVPATSIPEDQQTGLPEGVAQQTFSLNLGEVGAFTDSMTQFASESSTKVYEQNGFPMGYLEDYQIDQSGVIRGIYSNGNTRELGQVALASFTNPGGLEKEGETNFSESINTGVADIGASGVAGKGNIMAGTLEMSNVDLAEQFTDMIVTQRGFQANSRTIQTTDQMLQEVLTLKR